MHLFFGLFLSVIIQVIAVASTFIENVSVYTEVDKQTPVGVTSNDWFGSSVAVSGNYAIVGAYADDSNGTESGSAYIFSKDGNENFVQTGKLTASDATAGDQFGYSVAISGSYAIIGAYGDDGKGTHSGSAYIFTDDGSGNFIQTGKLTASDAAAGDQFGYSVAISGNYAVVGAYQDDDGGLESGSAYIFENDGSGNFIQTGKLTASDAAAGDLFGSSVAINGDYAVVGAYLNDDGGSSSGSAYIFENDGSGNFIQTSKLTASDAAAGDLFGSSVSISGGYAVVSAYQDDDNGTNSGSAYIFENDGSGNFIQTDKLTASDAAADDWFGTSVSISDDYAVVGAYLDDDGGSSSGSAYIFKNDGNGIFNQIAKLTASDAAAYDLFGASIAISGDDLIVGAYLNDDVGSDSGSLYIFRGAIEATILDESQTFSLDIDARDVTGYAIFGTDDNLFDINNSTGKIIFLTPPDYENPSDSNADNVYELSVTAEGTLNSDTRKVKITVEDTSHIIYNSYTYDELNKLIASDAAADDRFGSSVSISGDYAVIGAYSDNDGGSESGSAYIFKNDGNGNFIQTTKLTASDAEAGDWFGYSVSISGDYAVVGAYWDDDNGTDSGSAYIFKNDGSGNFIQTAKLTASDAAADDRFGYSVAISGDYAIVGAVNNSSLGSVYVFKRDIGVNTFTEIDKFTATDTAANIQFGYTISISDDYAVVGAFLDDDNGTNSGSAYIFKNDGSGNFIQTAKLTASDAEAGDRFGYSVSISGAYVVVGAYLDDDNGTDSGSAYIFKNDGSGNFIQIDKLIASDAAAGDYFGTSVAISGNYVTVGAPSSGNVTLFKNDAKDNFVQIGKLTASSAAADELFGRSIAISGDYIVVGASQDDDNGTDSGSTYIFEGAIQAHTLEENVAFSLNIAAPDAALSFFGIDKELFNINVSTGEITFKSTPDYENPLDADSDNVYELSVTAEEISKLIKITVKNTPVTIQNTNTSYSGVNKEVSKLTASDAEAGDMFGQSVSISGDYAVVGAHLDADGGSSSGSAYIFKKNNHNNLVQTIKLTASDAEAGDRFGQSVSISGDYAVVGAYLDADGGSSSGSAYIFKNDGSGNFIQTAKLTASDAEAGDMFGYSVSISDDYAVVGAFLDDDNGTDSGSAYIFKNNGNGNFIQTAKLTASDAATGDEFGYSVAISSDYAVVGARKNTQKGSAYIFKNDGSGNFVQIGKLTASDTAISDDFGSSVSISGGYAVVGAHNDDDNGTSSGSAYIFKNDGFDNFNQSAKLTASDAVFGDHFGISVAIDSDNIIIGSQYDDDNGTSSGSAYIFRKNDSGTFLQETKLTASDIAENDNFGSSVAIYGDYAVVGAHLNDDNGTNSGSAYIFKTAVIAQTNENNISFSLDIDATESETTDYTISGVDSHQFNVDSITGEITFKVAPDYENPSDVNTDNVYELNVTANGILESDSRTVRIEVTDGDDDAPTGYSVEFDLSGINASQTDSTSFTFTNAEMGTTYDYSVSSSRGGGSVTGSGSVTAVDQSIMLDDLSGLFDGTLTISVTLTDSANNEGDTVTHNTILNAVTEGIAVTVIDDTTSEADSDNSALFSVTLMSQPEHNVDIALDSNNTAEGVVTIPASKLLTFTPADWDLEQNVTVVGVDDSQKDGDIAYSIDLNASSSDSEYHGKSTQVNLINSDDEGGMIPAIIMYLLD